MNTIDEMLKIIVGECCNGCTDERSTFEYFERYHPGVDRDKLRNLIKLINFSAIRENAEALYL